MEMPLPNRTLVFFITGLLIGVTGCVADITSQTGAAGTGADLPLWCVRLPGDAGIYNDGMIGLPVVNGKVLFHSTLFTSPYQEDNRIHALDVLTGKLIWTYPREYKANEPYYFGGKPYVFDSTIVIKMPAFSPYSCHDRILILDGENGVLKRVLHMHPRLSQFASRDVAGFKTTAWFVQEDELASVVYSVDIETGDTAQLARICSSRANGRMEVSTRELNVYSYNGKHLLLLGLTDYMSDRTDSYLVLVDTYTGSIFYKRKVAADDHFPVNYAVLKDSCLIYTSGRIVGCINSVNDKICWQRSTGSVVDSMKPGVLVQNSVLFLWGHKGCMALDKVSGDVLYRKNIECANVNGFSPWIYIVRYDGRLTVLHESTGTVIKEIQVPFDSEERNGISYGCKPGVGNGSGVFLFGKYRAYYYKPIMN